MKKQYHAMGLMSGSSLDGLDIACCRFEMNVSNDTGNPVARWDLLHADTMPYAEKWVTRLSALPAQNALTFAKTHTYFGHYMAELVNDFLAQHAFEPDFIASHGHTVFHYPDKLMTSQIGDGAALAALTGYPVVADFRTQDIALKGEGTPIAPAADRYLFEGYDFYLNIGGIANITAVMPTKTIAYDIAPANQIFNRLAQQVGQDYDHNGQLAANGQPDPTLLSQLNQLPYFSKNYPKSLDNQRILQEILPIYLQRGGEITDLLHTACQHLGYQVSQSVRHIIQQERLNKTAYRMLVTGGGAFNLFLLESIQQHCSSSHNLTIELPDRQIIRFKEAILMGLMGVLRLNNFPNCMASVTGAQRDSIGGAVYQGQKKQC